MSLRQLEATLPAGCAGGLGELLDGRDGVHAWSVTPREVPDGAPPGSLLRALVESSATEALGDLLVGHFGARADFRVVLLAVEATLPPLPAPEPPPETATSAPAPRRLGRVSREELWGDLAEASEPTRGFLAMTALSTVVAAVGLLRGDVAVLIGAMVIAPLLGPNMALALAATLGDTALARRSLRANAVGVLLAGGLSVALGAVFTVDPAAHELAARTSAGLGDVVLALAAGAAGTLAFTSGVSTVVVGVMVAVALLPPLVAAGLLAGSGHLGLAAGALVLLLTNVTCVNLAAVGTFLVQRVGPRTWWEAERARRATRLAVASWVAMLVVLLVLILLGLLETGPVLDVG